MRSARAVAHTNIALVKYWGKRESLADLNLPAVGSLSLTLDRLRSETTLCPSEHDSFTLNEETAAPDVAAKVFRHLDRVWSAAHAAGPARDAARSAPPRPPCAVTSRNYLPTAAGLASSASGFAALTLAAAAAFAHDPGREALSTLARRGSGSAARSLWGGFVRQARGVLPDGSDCRAYPLFPPDHWDLRLLVAHAGRGPKALGSTAGMQRSRETSPYYQAWVDTAEADLAAAEAALAARDLPVLGDIIEHSCFKMHACMMASRPPILYWRGATLDLVHAVWRARAEGLSGYVTSDAGPHVKVLCPADQAEALAARLRAVPGVDAVDVLAPGPDPTVEVLP